MKTILSILLFVVLDLAANVAATQNVRGGRQQEEIEVVPNAMFGSGDEPPVHEEPESLIAMQFSDDPYAGQDKMEHILAGRFTLMNVHLSSDHNEALAVFCEFSTQQQDDDPSLAPRYLDLYGESEHCIDHGTMVPLHVVAEACRQRDEKTKRNSRLLKKKAPLTSSSSHNSTTPARMQSIEPTAFIFHQPKSGSTLLSNMITVASPSSTRVISEPQAIHEIVNCKKCSLATKKQALQDTMYLIGRTAVLDDDKEDHHKLYMKLTASSTAAGLSLITQETYPTTKWLFLHRDPATILQKLMSHRIERRYCDESKRRNPGPDMEHYLLTHHHKSKKQLKSPEQACAAYLATNAATVDEVLTTTADANLAVSIDYDTNLLNREGLKRVFRFLEIENPNWERVDQQRKKRAVGGDEWNGEAMLIVTEEVASATAEFSVVATF